MSEKFGHKLNAFYQFRSIFAPLIEGLILLDRLTYLQEQVSFVLHFFKKVVHMYNNFLENSIFGT